MATVQGNAFESQNGAAVIQTSKIKPYRCDLRHVLALLKIWLFWMIFEPGHKTTGRCAFFSACRHYLCFASWSWSSPLCCACWIFCISSLAWVKEIYLGTGQPQWPHCERNLVTGLAVRWCCRLPLDFHEKKKNRPGSGGCDWQWADEETCTIFLPQLPVHQRTPSVNVTLKHIIHFAGYLPLSAPGYAM